MSFQAGLILASSTTACKVTLQNTPAPKNTVCLRLKTVRGQLSAVIDSFRNLGFQEHTDELVVLLSRTIMQA
ncbi:hypothetical protein [Levilactobacillus brevis]|uniref:hypothetical protein n=1 Tax=Levilactobacillus brevis TaxID=1580 RepID=UPI00374E6B9A